MNIANGNNSSLLASGKVTPTLVYTIEASVQGPLLLLAINGVKVGSASNTELTATSLIGLGFSNTSNTAGAVLFSNYIFIPLP